MRFFTIATRCAAAIGMLAALAACSPANDGYPKISEIKTPHPNFLTPKQQRARKNQMERAKAAHVYRERSRIRERSRRLKANRELQPE